MPSYIKTLTKLIFLVILPTVILFHWFHSSAVEPPVVIAKPTQPVRTNSASFSDMAVLSDSRLIAIGATGGDVHQFAKGEEERQTFTPILENASFSFIDSYNGWAFSASAGAAVWRTNDGGENWWQIAKFSGVRSNRPLNASRIHFVDAHNGWLNDELGIWRSVDGGKDWNVVFPLGQLGVRQLADAAFVDDETAFVTSSDGILVTHDGGDTWQLTNKGWRFTSIAAANNLSAWAITLVNKLISTADGGVTWSTPSQLPIGEVLSLQFVNESDGWAAGLETGSQFGGVGVLVRTRDGGKSWKAVKVPNDVAFDRVVFASSNEGWLLGRRGLYRTSDGGREWKLAHEFKIAGS